MAVGLVTGCGRGRDAAVTGASAASAASAPPPPASARGPRGRAPTAPLTSAARARLFRELARLRGAFASLDARVTAADGAGAWRAYLDARRAWRALSPVAVLLPAAASQLEPERGEAGETPDDRGLRVLGDALLAEPPDWRATRQALDRTLPMVSVLEGEVRAASLEPRHLVVALSRGVFAWGQRLDGSAAERPDEALVDAFDGARGLLDWCGEVEAAVRAGDATRAADPARADGLGRAAQELRAWADAQTGSARDKLSALVASGRLGAALRHAGTAFDPDAVRAPFPPRRRTAAQPHQEPVHPATFPALNGPPVDAARAALGRQLFADPRLSRNGRLACASCHRLEHALSGGPTRPRMVNGQPTAREVPGLWNTAFEPMHLWDGRASSLAQQVGLAVEQDLGNDFTAVVATLSRDAALVAGFAAAFPGGLDAAAVRAALEEFERTLIADDSPFDRAVRGEPGALDAEQRRGFDVYFGEARCSRCHRLPLTSGAEAPRFTRAELSVIGVPTRPAAAVLDADRGRALHSHRLADEHAFKVPTLRNLALTAPYFHHGGFRTLEQVVDFYAQGSGPGLGLALLNFDPDGGPFTLTAADRRALLRFLREALRDAPRALPSAREHVGSAEGERPLQQPEHRGAPGQGGDPSPHGAPPP